MDENFDELINDLIEASANTTAAYEWGSGIHYARKELSTAKDALRDEIAKLRAELAAEREKNRWIPVLEWCPAKDLWCLVMDIENPQTDRVFIGQHDGCGEFFDHYGACVGSIHRHITHWMPLPAPPEAQE